MFLITNISNLALVYDYDKSQYSVQASSYIELVKSDFTKLFEVNEKAKKNLI